MQLRQVTCCCISTARSLQHMFSQLLGAFLHIHDGMICVELVFTSFERCQISQHSLRKVLPEGVLNANLIWKTRHSIVKYVLVTYSHPGFTLLVHNAMVKYATVPRVRANRIHFVRNVVCGSRSATRGGVCGMSLRNLQSSYSFVCVL